MNVLRRAVTTSGVLACFLLMPSPSEAQRADWRLVPELRFGAQEGPQALTRVTGILPHSDPDKAYIAQPNEEHVKVIDLQTGQILATIGRKGIGPGEFQSITRLGWAGDTLVVTDRREARVSMFTQDGTHLRTQRILSEALAPMGRPAPVVAPAPGGRFWGEVSHNTMAIANGKMTALPLVLMSSTGEVERQVVGLQVAGMMAFADYGTGMAVFLRPLAARTLHDYSADGSLLATVDTSTAIVGGETVPAFTVTLYSDRGIEQYRKSFRYRPKKLSGAARDSILAAYSDLFSRGNSKPTSLELAERHVAAPADEPPVSDIMVTDEGSVWLRREEIGAPSQWVVLDRAGRHIANVTAPATARLLTVRGSHVYGTEEDALGVPYVVRYRIQVD